MNTNNLPNWIYIPERYRLVKYSKRWYELESSLFLHLEFGKFPDLGPGYRVERLGWGSGTYRIYKTSKIPIISISDFVPEFIYIPASNYWMDEFSKNSERRDPTKKKLINLAEYWICRMPVTIKQFSYFINDYGYRTTEEVYRDDSYIWSSPNGNVEEIDINPDAQVSYVSTQDIDTYCNWLGQITGKKYGLPSVAEWENAYNRHNSKGSFLRGEWDEWTADFEDVEIGYDPECTGEPIYYKTKRMYHVCGGTKSLSQRNFAFSASKTGFRLVVH
jgi:hypothetical protein